MTVSSIAASATTTASPTMPAICTVSSVTSVAKVHIVVSHAVALTIPAQLADEACKLVTGQSAVRHSYGHSSILVHVLSEILPAPTAHML